LTGVPGTFPAKWPIYTNIGAVGPDLFFFCQDYSSGTQAPDARSALAGPSA